jgi:hypothetical protein
VVWQFPDKERFLLLLRMLDQLMFVCLAGLSKALMWAAATVSALVELTDSAGTMYAAQKK